MRKTGFSLLSLVAGVCLLPTAAFAQDAPPPPAPPAEPAPIPAPAAAPAPATPQPSESEVAPAPAPMAPAEAAPAAPTYPQTTIQGGVEGTYNHMFGKPHQPEGTLDPADAEISVPPVPTRAYDSGNGFLLNQASLFVKHQLNENVYAQIRLDAGANAGINSFGTSRLFDVREAFAVATGSGFTFTAGKFVTYEGVEVVDGWLNPTLTRGYLYYLAEPVTHVGAKLHYTADALDIGVGIVNGWDSNNGYFASGDNNSQKTLIWRLAYTTAPFWAAFSGIYGVEKSGTDKDPRLSLDLTGAAVISPMLAINFQGNYGTEKNLGYIDSTKSASWFGFGIQPLVRVDAISLGGRFEFFQDKEFSRTGYFAAGINPKDENGVAANTKNKVSLWTLAITPGYTIASALLLRAEFRVDGANEEVLWGGKKTQTSFALGAAYMF